MDDAATLRRGKRQLRRLGTLTDVVYGIVIWRTFMLIPRPGVFDMSWSTLQDYVTDEWLALLLILVGLVFTIVYWIQNNTLFGALERTDARHTILSILQIFFLLVFLYSLRLGIELDPSAATRAAESATAAAVGITGAWAWRYAIHSRRLLHPDVTDEEARMLARKITGEPITALITLPVAFAGPIFWELSWFSYPVIASWVRRRRSGDSSPDRGR